MLCSTMMKKYPKYQLRVSEEMFEWLKVKGANWVRATLDREMNEVNWEEWVRGASNGGSVETSKAEQPDASKASVPSWSKGRVGEEVSSSSSAAPVADAPVATPRYVPMRGRTEAERAAGLAAARSLTAGVKMMAQMLPKEDPDALGDPEPEEG